MEAEAANKHSLVKGDLEEPTVTLKLISRLPDEMLDIIISFLPTKSSVQTIVLSKRWRDIWIFTKLNLIVDHHLCDEDYKRIDAVSNVLAAHPGPARRLFVGPFSTRRELYYKFDEWFRSSSLDGLEDLVFQGATTMPSRALPRSAFRFTLSLCTLRLTHFFIPQIHAAHVLIFTRLKQIQLKNVFISEVTIDRLLARCIVLEDIRLQGIHGLTNIYIVSPTLHTLAVSNMFRNECCILEFQELVIVDAPCLG
jgi:hypothetical protein